MTATCHSQLILGGARSGKSRYALARAQLVARPTVFVATARPLDDDMRARIARHRAERPPSWTTVEEPWEVAQTCRGLIDRSELCIVDCLTVWVSNLVLRGDRDEAILSAADGLARLLAERALSLILVSNEVGAGVHPPTEVGLRFRDLLGSVNQRVAAAADRVTMMVAGIPVEIKDVPARPETHAPAPEAP